MKVKDDRKSEVGRGKFIEKERTSYFTDESRKLYSLLSLVKIFFFYIFTCEIYVYNFFKLTYPPVFSKSVTHVIIILES